MSITAETCPHYLALTAEEIGDHDLAFKCAPPIRDAVNRDRLWDGLAAGTIDMVVSDHSPCPGDLKQGGFAGGMGRNRIARTAASRDVDRGTAPRIGHRRSRSMAVRRTGQTGRP